MTPVEQVLAAIKASPGRTWRQIAESLDMPDRHVEDIVWALWRDGKIQMEHDSTLRVTRPGEKVFRHDP